MTIGTAESYEDAVAIAEDHTDLIRGYEDWDLVERIEDDVADEFRLSVTIFEVFGEGDDFDILADQIVLIDGGDVLASAIFTWEPFDDLTARQLIFYDMLWIGEGLSDFAKH